MKIALKMEPKSVAVQHSSLNGIALNILYNCILKFATMAASERQRGAKKVEPRTWN